MAGMGGEERSTVGPHHHRKAALPYQRVAPSVSRREKRGRIWGPHILQRQIAKNGWGGEMHTTAGGFWASAGDDCNSGFLDSRLKIKPKLHEGKKEGVSAGASLDSSWVTLKAKIYK